MSVEKFKNNWVSVEKFMPLKGTKALIISKRYGMLIATYSGDVMGWVMPGLSIDDITHWRALPDRPTN
jgi:hypothetical protein